MTEQKTLYVSDMDGTLLSSDGHISQHSAEIISDLSRRGACITVATARTPATVVPLLRGTHTNTEAIVMTGAALWNRKAGSFSHTRVITQEQAIRISVLCRSNGVHPFVYVMSGDGRTLDVYHGAPAFNKAEQKFYDERRNLTLKRFHLHRAMPDSSAATLLFFATGPADTIESLATAVRTETECAVSCYPDIFCAGIKDLEIMAPGVSKATAIQRLAAQTGAKRIVVFGDNLNDLPMFAIADTAVAVGNAIEEVISAADIVIEPNYTDSVARFIAADFYN